MWTETTMQESCRQHWHIFRWGSYQMDEGGVGGCVWDSNTEEHVQMGRGLMQALTHSSQPVCCTSAEACSSYSRHLKKNFPVESNGEAVRLDGGVCFLPVSLMELDTHLLRVGVKSAMMSSETMTHSLLITQRTWHINPLGQTGACMVTLCSHLLHWFFFWCAGCIPTTSKQVNFYFL